MKRNYLILTAIAFVLSLAFAGCKKNTPETLNPKITDENVTVTATSATFTWTVDWAGKRISVVELSEHEDMSDSQFYGSEEELNKSEFVVTVNDLQPNTKYYYRFWVWNQNYVNNKFVMEEKTFETSTGVPNVKTLEVKDVTRTTAKVVGEVTEDNGAAVTERGVCWSTNHNPTISDDHEPSGNGMGTFTTEVSGLRASQAYYVRAYAINSNGTEYGEELSFVTGEVGLPEVIIQSVTVNSAFVTVNCNVISDGGASVTKRGVCWSTESNPEYSDHHQTEGSGTGEFAVNLSGLDSETTYHVRAYAINSVDTAYSEDMTFTTSAAPQAPTGAINGQFSVSDSKTVWFSKGNLQYIGNATTPYWRFADNQWSVLGDNGQGSAAPNVNRDLFGWGTSGYHDSGDLYNTNYQPYSTSSTIVNTTYNYYGYGPSTNQSNPNIAGSHYDWGVHNPISNGGNQAGLWRTLTKDECVYLFDERQNVTVNGTSNARYAKGLVNNVYGMIIFPDNYLHPNGVTAPFGINDPGDTGWNYNSYDISDWAKMEEKGCVFLPIAGRRKETTISDVDRLGYYWSSSYCNKSLSYLVHFSSGYFYPANNYDLDHRCDGYSVRLVRDAQ